MKLSMAQMSMNIDISENSRKILGFCDAAADSDLLFFPEVQYTPFFAQYSGRDASEYLMEEDGTQINDICKKARDNNMYISPNIYLRRDTGNYDASFWINPEGKVEDISTMVHILSADKFFEKEYYSSSTDGFKVFDTPFGKIGIVICFDRHMPESIRTCALRGADLVIIPTANHTGEPMELFEWEIRTQAMQNQVFIAMCNRVGAEGDIVFAGESLVAGPSGELIIKADGSEQLVTVELDLSQASQRKKDVPFLTLRRCEMYQ